MGCKQRLRSLPCLQVDFPSHAVTFVERYIAHCLLLTQHCVDRAPVTQTNAVEIFQRSAASQNICIGACRLWGQQKSCVARAPARRCFCNPLLVMRSTCLCILSLLSWVRLLRLWSPCRLPRMSAAAPPLSALPQLACLRTSGAQSVASRCRLASECFDWQVVCVTASTLNLLQ